ncbi:MAG TPA: sugar ABC transporter substrate-binding protein [Acetobacteraceae bacterium]|nr:sugar ABC transporter substrate-binding protein [Acetobacteraceae bacterium]
MLRPLQRRLLLAVSFSLLGIGLAMPARSAEDPTSKHLSFVFVSHGPDADTWWNTIKGALKVASSELNVSVTYRNPPNGDLATMARIIDQAAASHPDGIISTIADFDVLKAPIQHAVQLGIPVITVNSGTEEQSHELGALMHIGQPEYIAGLEAGKRAKAAGMHNFLCVNHFITNPVSVDRCKGFAEGLGVPLGNQMIDSGIDPVGVENKVTAYLRANPKTEAILTLGPNSAEPTIRALKNMHLAGKIFFGTFDLSSEIVDGIKDGTINFAIDQQPFLQGYLPVLFLTLYDRYGVIPANNVRSGPGFVTKDNVEVVSKLAGLYR